MSTDAVVLVEKKENGVVDLVINRPKQLNALNKEVLTSLEENLKQLNSDTSVRAVVLRGSGDKAFIAGADIKEMQSMQQEEAKEFARLGQRVTLLFENLKVPTIAVVQGFALGGGCEMAMACDFIFASNGESVAKDGDKLTSNSQGLKNNNFKITSILGQSLYHIPTIQNMHFFMISFFCIYKS